MIAGRRFWIVIWYGILGLGTVGLLVSLYWGRRTRWKNLEEILRAVGTITVSLGMLLILYDTGGGAEQTLLVASVFSFILAFVLGRRSAERSGTPPEDEDDSPE